MINNGKFLDTDKHIIGDAFIDSDKRLKKLEAYIENNSETNLEVFSTIQKMLSEHMQYIESLADRVEELEASKNG